MKNDLKRMPQAMHCTRLVIVGSLLALLGVGCGDDASDEPAGAGAAGSDTGGVGGSDAGSSGASASGGSGGSTTMSGAGGSAGSGGSAATGGAGGAAGSQEPTPPPEMPRELGPADGIYCESAFDPPPETCSVGSRCCPNGLGSDREEVCIEGDQLCPACDTVTCGQLRCDGPEDCPSAQFCCYAMEGSCKDNADCTAADPVNDDSSWTSTECQARCVSDLRDPDHGMVACKDDRDCPGPLVAGSCRALGSAELPFGLKVCYGTGS
jgi:hypothetical protein